MCKDDETKTKEKYYLAWRSVVLDIPPESIAIAQAWIVQTLHEAGFSEFKDDANIQLLSLGTVAALVARAVRANTRRLETD